MIFELHYERSRKSYTDFGSKMDQLCQVLNLDSVAGKSLQLRKYLSDFGVLYDFADLKTNVSERRSLSSSVNIERMKK